MIDLSPRQLATVKSILAEHVPECEVRAYGSRATWTARDYSDVDLAVVGKGPLDREVIADLKEAFQDSDLPMRVDVLDWHSVSEEFREAIKAEMVVLPVRGSDRSHVATVWQEAKLGNLVRLISGGTPSKKRAAYWNGAIPWASARDMKQFRLRDTIHHVTAEGLANGTKRVPVGTLLLLTRGMRLLKELPVCVTQRPMAFNQDVKALLPKDQIDRSFLAYLVLGNKHRLLNLVDLAGHGTGRINSDELRALDVRLPPKPEQRAIAHVLGTLDDKIELNRRMNETLEAMARALFRSWFVDFDPVRAKMKGRDTGLPDHLADLFPERLVDSEMGEMPEGWSVFRLDQLARHHTKSVSPYRSPDLEYEHFSIPAFDAGQRPAVDPGGSIRSNKTVVQEDAVLLSKLNPRIARVWVPAAASGRPQICSTEFLVFTPRPPANRSLLFALFADRRFRDLLKSLVTGTSKSHQRVPPKALKAHEVMAGSAEAFAAFGETMGAVLSQVLKNRSETSTLADLRDTLLPKLISGEIRVLTTDRGPAL